LTETGISNRDRQFFGPGPKRILALDGGGTRGVIELAFLERIEALLRAEHAHDPTFRLSDWFQLIGGTSTGAIIAAGLAMGKQVAEITQLYLDLAPQAFRKRSWRIMGLVPRFGAKPLVNFLQAQLGERNLDSDDLLTGFAVIAQRFDMGSPWLISNNPCSPYWEDPADGSYIGNRHYRLREIVRASTAAPGFFQPQWLQVAPGSRPALFVDGGLSPYNNPSLMLILLTQARAFGLQWQPGPEALSVISIGAGQYRMGLAPGALPPKTAGGLALHSLMEAVSNAQMQTLTMLQWFSEPAMPWIINSEIGNLAGDVLGGRPLLNFQRYDMALEASWLESELGFQVKPAALARLRRFDDPGCMKELYAMAIVAAEKQVRLEHLVTPE